MREIRDLSDHFLLATSQMDDPFFERSLILLTEYHAAQGAKGLMVNKQASFKLSDLLEDLSVGAQEDLFVDEVMMIGGPGRLRHAFVMEDPSDDTPVQVRLMREGDLDDLAQGRMQSRHHIMVGCCQWEPGQLEAELAEHAWQVIPFDKRLLFEVPLKARYGWASQSAGGIGVATLAEGLA